MSEAKRMERVVASIPRDRSAREVTEGAAEHWKATVRDFVPHFEVQPATRPVPDTVPNNLTGVRFGRFVVIGLHEVPHKRKGSQWVCRCSCGDFELRRTKAILSPRKPHRVAVEQMCEKCHYLEYVKWNYANLPPKNFR